LRAHEALLVVFLAAEACGSGNAAARHEAVEPAAVLDAFFSDGLTRCEKDADCVTRVCDLSPVFTFSVSGGYCTGFPNAFERWQRVLLARKLGEKARSDEELRKLLWERLDDESRFAVRGEEQEVLLLVPAAVGTQDAIERIRKIHSTADGALRLMAGLMLASEPGEDGLDAIVQGAQSSVERLRMHAASAAGVRCRNARVPNGRNEREESVTPDDVDESRSALVRQDPGVPVRRSLGAPPEVAVLADLLSDKNVQVRQAAAIALAECLQAAARPVLERRLEELRAGAPAKPGDLFVVESALADLEQQGQGK